MSTIPDTVRAFVAERVGDDVRRGITQMPSADLGEGHVTIRVAWSSVNYKDGLATVADGKVARISPLIPGIDLAGTVVEGAGDIREGDRVVVHGYDLGVAHHGGYAEYARVPFDWVVPLPPELTPRQAMAIGTAGFAAALSVVALEQRGLRPGQGPVVVTGASGGVGSTAVGILVKRGYEVVASTGKAEAAEQLRAIGAAGIVDRREVIGDTARPMGPERWAGAIDAVGGETLAGVVKTLRYGAGVAAVGNTAGPELPATIFPFILRGVALLGVDSVRCELYHRRDIWTRLADDLRPAGLDETITHEVELDRVEPALDAILKGSLKGRTVVRVGDGPH